MNYFEEILLALNNIKDKDENMLAFFSFGSFVTKETFWKNYKEIRVFDSGDFVLSKFNLLNINPDIDLLCVSVNPEKTKEVIDQNIKVVNDYFVTINVVSKEIFENELSSPNPNAIKRILLYRDLLVIKGQKYIDDLKTSYKKYEAEIDSIFQNEFDFRKNYLKLFAKNDVKTLIIKKSEYERLFPNVLKFIEGKLDAGFPVNRLKLVYPGPMELKAEVDLSNIKLKDII